jgi:hemoglobin
MKEIESREDITLLVDNFYGKVLQDSLLKPFFAGLDFQAHKPKMIDFWSFVLLSEGGYRTDVTAKHMHMPLKKEHFDRWIELFNETVGQLFEGEKAQLAKERAFLIRWTLESKISKE